MKNPIKEYINFVRRIERAKREGRTDELLRAARESAEIQKTMLRPRQYATINGVGEIGLGMFLLCMALSSYTSVLLPHSSWRGGISMCLLLCGAVAMPACLWAGNRFVTGPRIGHVTLRRERSRWVPMILGVVVAGGISIGLVLWQRHEMAPLAQFQAHDPGAASPGAISSPSIPGLAWIGPMYALLYLMANAVSIREHRWKWGVLILMLVGTAVIRHFVSGNSFEAWRPVGLFLGLLCLVSGLVTLSSFLRHHQPVAPEAE